jgi:hypothetical protein
MATLRLIGDLLFRGLLCGLLRCLHLTPLALQPPSSLDLKPPLYLFSLLPTVSKRVLALLISQEVFAARAVSFFACEIGAAHSDPIDQAAAAELKPAGTLRVAAGFLGLDQGLAVRAGFEGFTCLLLGFAVDGCKTGLVLEAGFFGVFWSIAVGADLELADFAGEDAAVCFAIVGLDCLESIAAVHTDVAFVDHHLHGMAA